MTAFTVQLKDGRILNRQRRSALLVSSTSWTGTFIVIYVIYNVMYTHSLHVDWLVEMKEKVKFTANVHVLLCLWY